MGSTLKVRPPEAKTLIDKIKAEIKKRAEFEGAADAPEGTQKEAEALTARLGILGSPQNAKPARTEAVRILADDPPLKLASETRSHMRMER